MEFTRTDILISKRFLSLFTRVKPILKTRLFPFVDHFPPIKLLYFFFFSVYCCPVFTFAQPEIAEIKHFEEGLIINQVAKILQDEEGLFWLLTQELNSFYHESGSQIVQFDGWEFRTLYDTPHPDVLIRELFQLGNNELLINYDRPYFDVFNTLTGHFEEVKLDDFWGKDLTVWGSLNERSEERFFGAQTPEKVWLTAWNGRLDTICSFPYQKSKYDLRSFFQHGDAIWVSKAGLGSIKYDRVSQKWKRYSVNDIEGVTTIIDEEAITFGGAAEAPNGDLIFAMRGVLPGYFKYNPHRDKFEPIPQLPAHLGSDLPFTDKSGRILMSFGSWRSKKDGLWLLDLDGRFIDYSRLLQIFDPSIAIYWFFSEDFTDHLWLSTSAGLTYIKLQKKKKEIERLLTAYSMRSAIELAPGKTLFTTELNDWFLWDEVRDTLTPFTIFQDGRPQSADYCRGLYLDKNNGLWASNYLGILKVDLSTRRCDFFESPVGIQAFTRLKNGHFLLLGNDHPIPLEFDPATKTFTDYIPLPEGLSLIGRFCHSVRETADGAVWVGTNRGLIKYDKAGRKVRNYTQKDGLRSNVILVVHEEADGKLWLGTSGAGVHIFDPQIEEFTYLQEKDGLVDNTVAGILKDVDGDWWFSTFDGVSCYKQEEESFLNFNTEDGFSYFEFNRFSFYQKTDGRLCLGTLKGMNIFDPHELKGEPSLPKLLLREAQFYDRSEGRQKTRRYNLSQLTEIRLPPHDRHLRLRFVLSELGEADLHKFSYFLEGYDEGWNRLNFKNEVVFNKLPVGDYTLHLRGVNARGERNVNPVSIHIQVAEYFYKTAWFIGLCLLLFVASVYALYRYRLNQIYKMMELRTKIAGDLHDDVGGLLTGIAMQTEILELRKDPPEKSKLRRLRELSQEALSQMRDVVWSIDARRDKIGDLLDRMREQAEEMLAPKGIEYKITASGLDEKKALPIEIRQHLYLIFKEALSNAVRHAQANRLEIRLENRDDAFEMRIRDNGVGLDPGKKTTGLGLDNIKMRAAKIQATVEFINCDGLEIWIRRKTL